MKLFIKYLLTVLLLPLFAGCASDDGYPLDRFWIEVASVVPLEGGGYYVKLDDGTTLWPAASAVTETPNTYSRAQVNYTILSDAQGEYDHYVKINYLSTFLTKNIVKLSSENEDVLGNDKIKILELWEGDDYLNIHFGVNIGGGGVQHSINLAEASVGEDGTVNLEFRHNANGDAENYGVKGLVAFDLRPYQQKDGKNIIFKITLNAFQGSDSEYIFTYNYTGTKNKSNQTAVEVYTDDLFIK